MKKGEPLFIAIIFAFILSVSVFVAAKPDFSPLINPAGNSFEIPAHAIQISEGVFSLGTARDADGRLVQGFMFVHEKRENAKPSGAGGGGGSTCYAFLAKGAKWKTVEPWIVNTVNSEGLTQDFVYNNLVADIQKWEDASSFNILGDGSSTSDVLVADTSSPDNKNEVYFADVDSSGAIAVTIVWGIFSGPIGGRELVEWDQIYNDADFGWSSSGEAGKMDFENIATHELGHSVGMGHPSSGCTEETMYAYADFGETKKRNLYTGDIAGIGKLY